MTAAQPAIPVQDHWDAQLLDAARQAAARPLLVRVFRADDVPPEYLDSGAAALRGSNRREFYALSNADFYMGCVLAEELPLIATAAGRTGDAALRTRVLAQLAELARWRPLERPGWTLYLPGDSVPNNYNDGKMLGTGMSLRAIVMTLRIMGNEVPGDLHEKLRKNLALEVAEIRDDFRVGRPWYCTYPTSNQFVLPNTGLLLACTELGRGRGDSDYEFGIKNLTRAMDAQGFDGAHHEGGHYGAYAMKEILYAAMAAQQHGDDRLARHPYPAKFGQYLAHMTQPGGYIVNIFDGSDRHVVVPDAQKKIMTGGRNMRDALALAAIVTGDTRIGWVLDRDYGGAPPNLVGQEYRKRFGAAAMFGTPPKPYAAFDSSPLVVWRSGWGPRDMGVWVRGGSPLDSHDHRDQGHVNCIIDGREVLIEAGSANYATPDIARNYQSGRGHNVLQIGGDDTGLPQKGTQDSPIQVVRLDDGGGDVSVNPTGQYDPARLERWQRRVTWDRQALTIRDEVQLPKTKPDRPLFRFHLGSVIQPEITVADSSRRVTLSWHGGRIEFDCDQPIVVTTEPMPHGISYFEKTGLHTCVLVAAQQPLTAMRLTATLKTADFHSK